MADTLATLRSNLRQRIGEISAGTWTDSELNTYLNLAQREVCKDCVLQGRALLVTVQEIAVEGGDYQIALPSDFIDVILLQHLHEGSYYTVYDHAIAQMYDRFDPDSTGSIFQYFAVHGQVAAILDEGVVTSAADSNTTLTNSHVDFTTLGLSTIDRVVNLTDGSSATITSVANPLVTSGLTGGATNLFRTGDRYQIESGEEYLPLLHLYPPLSDDTDTEVATSYTTGSDDSLVIGNSGGTDYRAAQSFQLTDPIQLHSVRIDLDTSVGSPLGPLTVEIQTDASGPSGTLVAASDPETAGGIDSPTTGWNEALFEEDIRLAANTTYWIVVYARSQTAGNYYTWSADTTSPGYSSGSAAVYDGATWTVDTTKDALFEVYSYTGSEALKLHYARYAREMTSDTDVCELPIYAYEAVYLWAEYQAYLKRYGRGRAQTQEALALYGEPRDGVYGTGEIGKLRRLVARRGQTAYSGVQDVMSPWRRQRTTHKNVPLNVRLPLG